MRSDEEDYDEDEDEVQDLEAQDEDMEDGAGEDEGADDEEADDGQDDEGEGEGDEDEDEDEEEDGDAEEEDEDEDEEEDDEEDRSDEEEGGDEEMDVDGDESRSAHLSPARSKTSVVSPLPAHLKRRSLFVPGYARPPASLTVEAIVGIPLPAPTHALAASACLSYLLTGAADGHVRAYDFWASVNGAQVMTSQQRAVVGLGEGVHKAGVARGWWANDVEHADAGAVVTKAEPVYSLACEADALWALTGTQSGPINMYTLRHAPGHHVHSLKGHTNVVSCLSLLPDERGLLSGSWDGTVREWDLNTGQTVRTYPSHGAQISSLSLRPANAPSSPAPNIAISAGPDFFDKPEQPPAPAAAAEADASTAPDPPTAAGGGDAPPAPASSPPGGVDMASAKSPESYDPLFDDDADADGDAQGESVPVTEAATPTAGVSASANGLALGANGTAADGPAALAAAKMNMAKPSLSLALPGVPKPSAAALPNPNPPSSSASSTSRLFNPAAPSVGRTAAASTIPLLSPASYRAFSGEVMLVSSMDGQVTLVDRRIPSRGAGAGPGGALEGVGRLLPGDKAPPWCMSACWSGDGTQVYAGRRNGTVDVWDVRRASSAGIPNVLRSLRTPAESGPVSCIVAFPDGRHIATASTDNVRLWNTADLAELDESTNAAGTGAGTGSGGGTRRSRSRPPFKIIAGHHGGTVSSMLVDATSRFLVTASGDRGWQGESTRVVLVHEIKW
ncbi:Transcription factor spt8 [Cryptotrichosporon argae]